jgi:hypothetical protein
VAIVAVAAIARLPSYHVALERDTGQMLYGGGIVLDGDTPYVDAALNKGPATYVLFAAVRALSGRSEVAVRLTLLAFVVVAALGLAGYLDRVAGRGAALLGGLLLAVLAPLPAFQGDDPNLPQYAIAPMAVALALAVRPSPAAAAGAGALAALTALLSPAFLIPLGPALALALWRGRATYPRRAGYAVAAGAVVVLLAALWLGLAGALDDLRRQVPGTWHQPEVASGPALLDVGRLLDVPVPELWLAALVGCVVAARRPALRLPAATAGALILLSWGRVKIGDHLAGDLEHPHHFYPALIGLVLGLTLGVVSVWPEAVSGRIAVAGVLVGAFVVVDVVRPQVDALGEPVARRGVGGIDWGAAYPAAEAVDRLTRPDETLFVAGSDPELYWLADRRAPTRFFDVYPILAHPPYAQERSRALREHPPAAVAALPAAPIEPDVQRLVGGSAYRLAFEQRGTRVWLRRGEGA